MTRGAGWWALAFLVATAVAFTGWFNPVNHAVAIWLAPLGRDAYEINFVWIVGGIPATMLAMVLLTWLKPGGWRWLLLFVVGILIEALTKHWIATPMPLATPQPHWLEEWETWTNPTPAEVNHLLGIIFGGTHPAAGHHEFFRGSYFSGHVFRITFVTAAMANARRWIVPLVALVAGVCVVATGGHWLWDVVGAFLLTETGLSILSRVTR